MKNFNPVKRRADARPRTRSEENMLKLNNSDSLRETVALSADTDIPKLPNLT